MRLSASLLLLTALIGCSWSQDIEECVSVEPGVKITKVENKYGCGILECFNQTSNASQYVDYNYAGWILPDLTIVNGTYDDGRIMVNEDIDSYTLTIRNITSHDVGLYHCMLEYIPTGEYYLIKLGLNVKGPFFINKWERYRMNTIVGCSAFGGFLVLSGLVYLIYCLRYVPDDDDKSVIIGDQPMVATEYGIKPAGLKSVPNYIPSQENGGPASKDSPDSLRKRAPSDKSFGYENRAFTSDLDKPSTNGTLDNSKVGEFFSEPSKDVISTEL